MESQILGANKAYPYPSLCPPQIRPGRKPIFRHHTDIVGDVTIRPPQLSVPICTFFRRVLIAKHHALPVIREAALTRILLGRVRDAGSGAKSWLKSHAYYHAYLLQKGFRTYGYQPRHETAVESNPLLKSPSRRPECIN